MVKNLFKKYLGKGDDPDHHQNLMDTLLLQKIDYFLSCAVNKQVKTGYFLASSDTLVFTSLLLVVGSYLDKISTIGSEMFQWDSLDLFNRNTNQTLGV